MKHLTYKISPHTSVRLYGKKIYISLSLNNTQTDRQQHSVTHAASTESFGRA